jgi:osmoprotectant transport system ATP-binding protein
MSGAIEFRAVTVATRQGQRLLDDVSLSVEAGTTTVLLGRSGSGKTTLLRTVNRMVAPTGGEVLVNGSSVRDADLIALRRSIGYVIQETGLFPHFTVERNVGIVLESEGRSREERARRSDDLLRAVGLDATSFGRRYPHQLSGGQRQRVGLARALAADPSALLMDEPFGALDPLTRGEMQDMLRELLGRMKKTVLLVTHDLNEALYLGDQIALLNEGKLIACLPRDKFLSSDLTEVRAYVASVQRGERSAEEAARR